MDETYTEDSDRVTNSSDRLHLRNAQVDYTVLPPGVRVEESYFTLKHNRFDVSVLTMVLISAITFFIPLFNGLLAGTFGGFHAGRPRRALAAAAVASVVVPAAFYVAFNVFSVGGERIFLGLGWGNWTLLHVIGLFIGALCGAASRPVFTGEVPVFRTQYVSGAPLLAQGDVAPALPEGSRDFSRDLPTTQVSPPSGPVRGE
ncbi:hypothetical protein COCOR_07457 [Corallococcus coralloides DSM 2259]|uniref:Uncharacterized protein n=1 Tax=Corallococcus coralloides (strain ATCC 25202 / DSM 2259 / NBRC 100086 / M2) TaxID=1144275 RepID=H8MNX6_CORCM|nr:hypothetical protein COCOR_07457 [Corallococcus coralloides DSM 2259]